MTRKAASLAVSLLTLGLVGGLGSTPDQQGPGDAHVSDPAGDVEIGGPIPDQKDEQKQFPEADILAAWIGPENESTVPVGLQFVTLEKSSSPNRHASVHFKEGNVSYQVSIGTTFGPPVNHHVRLYAVDAEGHWTQVAAPGFETNSASGTFSVRIPRAVLLDEQNVALRSGSILSEFFAEAAVHLPLRGYASAHDRAPDDGFGPNFESVHLAPDGAGDFDMRAAVPVRASNGGATTIVYNVSLANSGNRAHHVLLSVQNASEAWTVRTPNRLAVPAKSIVVFPVILVLGPEHEHGVTRYFTVRGKSQEDVGSWASMDLGVEWLSYPQPAGHHPRLFAHSAPLPPSITGYPYQEDDIWMNANSTGTDPQAEDEDVPWYAGGEFQRPDNFVARWRFPLRPALRMGLSFDPTTNGSLTTMIRPGMNSGTAQLEATLVYFCGRFDSTSHGRECPNRPRVLASGKSATTTFSSPTKFDVPLTVVSDFHTIPFLSGANVGLELALSTENPQSVPISSEPHPTLVVSQTNFWLPFLEYHDPVEPTFQSVGLVRLSVAGPSQKLVNPGRAAAFFLELRNDGAAAHSLRMSIEGTNQEWASTAASEVRAPAGKTSNVSVLVKAPESAAAGQEADLLVVVQSESDANVMALAHVRATVVDRASRDIPDESNLGGARDRARTPAVQALGVMAVAALLALFCRLSGRLERT